MRTSTHYPKSKAYLQIRLSFKEAKELCEQLDYCIAHSGVIGRLHKAVRPYKKED